MLTCLHIFFDQQVKSIIFCISTVFYLSNTNSFFLSYNMDTFEVEEFNIGNVVRAAYDWVHGNLYYVHQSNLEGVYVMNLGTLTSLNSEQNLAF